MASRRVFDAACGGFFLALSPQVCHPWSRPHATSGLFRRFAETLSEQVEE